jgi:hypothetical protein
MALLVLEDASSVYKCSINQIINSNPVCNHSMHLTGFRDCYGDAINVEELANAFITLREKRNTYKVWSENQTEENLTDVSVDGRLIFNGT